MTVAYKLEAGNSILRISDGAIIPHDPKNVDYIAYAAWVAAGNTPTAADPVLLGAVGASVITPAQILSLLVTKGILQQADLVNVTKIAVNGAIS